MLRDQAEASPNAVAYRFIVAGDELEHLTFRALEAQALAVAERLVRDGRRGERALLLYRPGLEFTVAFFACALAGVVAVPANPPEPARAARALPRLLAIIEDAEASLLLSSRTLRDFAESVLPGNNALLQLPFYATDPGPAPMGDSLPAIAPEALAFLQYTSGSTSTPRGVAISHEAVMRNLAMIDARLGPTMARAVSWVPFYHDLGLIGGVLLPIYAGGTSVLLSPLEFL
ncbi:MAG: AMP-binding protein, partial [Planctomycetota bacterium]|nr:AMP-binding protein [Planctomycetota bacterium]